MNEFKECCLEEVKLLDDVIKKSKRVLKNSPEGNLRVNPCGNTFQYYWKTDGGKADGDYIRKSERYLAEQLAQKDYASRALRIATLRKKQLLKYSESYNREEIVNLHEQLSIARQELVVPFIQSDEEYATEWLEKKRKARKRHTPLNSIYPLNEETGYVTERGEIVRSKSEKILADKMHLMGVTYVYEQPLLLKGHGVIYPDFTVLNKRTKEVYYWEHFGMMEISEYCNKALKKVAAYQKNGMCQGKKLITTFESEEYSVGVQELELIITSFFI